MKLSSWSRTPVLHTGSGEFESLSFNQQDGQGFGPNSEQEKGIQ